MTFWITTLALREFLVVVLMVKGRTMRDEEDYGGDGVCCERRMLLWRVEDEEEGYCIPHPSDTLIVFSG